MAEELERHVAGHSKTKPKSRPRPTRILEPSAPENPEAEEGQDITEVPQLLAAYDRLCSEARQMGHDLVDKELDVCRIDEGGIDAEKIKRTHKLVSQLFELFASNERDSKAKWERLHKVFSGEKQNELNNLIRLAQISDNCVVEPIVQGVLTVRFASAGKEPETYRLVVNEDSAVRDIGEPFVQGFFGLMGRVARSRSDTRDELKAAQDGEMITDKSVAERDKEYEEKTKRWVQEAFRRASERRTPDDLYQELNALKANGKMSRDFPDDLLTSLSQGPLFAIDQVYRDIGDLDNSQVSPSSMAGLKEKVQQAIDEFDETLKRYYGVTQEMMAEAETDNIASYLWKKDSKVCSDISSIWGLYGIPY